MAIDPQMHASPAAVVSEPGETDADASPSLLEQVEHPISRAGADGACDRRAVHEALDRRGA